MISAFCRGVNESVLFWDVLQCLLVFTDIWGTLLVPAVSLNSAECYMTFWEPQF